MSPLNNYESRNTNISDSSDWLSTSVPELNVLDDTLRCDICKEFMTAPMMTSCGHTFCSLCIRRALMSESRCPNCRSNGSESQLRKNVSLEVCIETFTKIRKDLMDKLSLTSNHTDETKRKANDAKAGSTDEEESEMDNKLKRKREDDEEHLTFPLKASLDQVNKASSIPPGCAPCPICQKVLPISQIQGSHINSCLSGGNLLSNAQSAVTDSGNRYAKRTVHNNSVRNASAPLGSSTSLTFSRSASSNPLHKKKPRPLDGGTISLSKLRARILKLGISVSPPVLISKGITSTPSFAYPTSRVNDTSVSREELLRRESEWITIWNANADRANPLPQSELIKQFQEWDRAEAITKAAKIEAAKARAEQQHLEQTEQKMRRMIPSASNIDTITGSNDVDTGNESDMIITNTQDSSHSSNQSGTFSSTTSSHISLSNIQSQPATPLKAVADTHITSDHNTKRPDTHVISSTSSSIDSNTTVANGVSLTQEGIAGINPRRSQRTKAKINYSQDLDDFSQAEYSLDTQNSNGSAHSVDGAIKSSPSRDHKIAIDDFNTLNEDESSSPKKSARKKQKPTIPPFIPKDLKTLNRVMYSAAYNDLYLELTRSAKRSLNKSKNALNHKEQGKSETKT